MKTPSLRIWRTDDGKVAMACPLPDAAIQYTTDDSDPVAEGVAYTAPLSVAVGTIVRAVATATGYDPSDEARLEVAGLPVLPAPTLSEGATHGSGTVVTVDVEILNAGSYPAGAAAWGKYGNVYFSGRKLSELTESIVCSVPSGETASIMVRCPGYADSAMSDITVVAPKVATPSFSYNQYTGQLTISCSTSGATIYYRIGASGSYQQYTAALTITENVTVYAYATRSGYTQSNTGRKTCAYVGYPAEGSTLPDPEITITYSGDNARIYWDNWSDYDGYLANPDASVVLEIDYSSSGYVVASDYLSLPLDEIESPISFRARDASGHYNNSAVVKKQAKILMPSLSLTRDGSTITGEATYLMPGVKYCYKIGSAPSDANDGEGSFTASSATDTFTYSSNTSVESFTMYLRGFKTGYDPSDSASDYISALSIPVPSFTISVYQRLESAIRVSGLLSNADSYPSETIFRISVYSVTQGSVIEDALIAVDHETGDISGTINISENAETLEITITADCAGVIEERTRTIYVDEYPYAVSGTKLPTPDIRVTYSGTDDTDVTFRWYNWDDYSIFTEQPDASIAFEWNIGEGYNDSAETETLPTVSVVNPVRFRVRDSSGTYGNSDVFEVDVTYPVLDEPSITLISVDTEEARFRITNLYSFPSGTDFSWGLRWVDGHEFASGTLHRENMSSTTVTVPVSNVPWAADEAVSVQLDMTVSNEEYKSPGIVHSNTVLVEFPPINIYSYKATYNMFGHLSIRVLLDDYDSYTDLSMTIEDDNTGLGLEGGEFGLYYDADVDKRGGSYIKYNAPESVVGKTITVWVSARNHTTEVLTMTVVRGDL